MLGGTLARIDFKLSLRNAIVNIRARELQQMEASAARQASASSHDEAASSVARQAMLPKSPAASDTVISKLSAAASAIVDETIAERSRRAVLSTLISPMKRVVKRIRNVLLTPLHAQVDGLQLLIYSLHEKVDDFLYSLHEKVDDALVKIDDAHAKLQDMRRTVEDTHVETTVRLSQLGELTQAIDSRLEEVAMRVRTPLRIDDSTF